MRIFDQKIIEVAISTTRMLINKLLIISSSPNFEIDVLTSFPKPIQIFGPCRLFLKKCHTGPNLHGYFTGNKKFRISNFCAKITVYPRIPSSWKNRDFETRSNWSICQINVIFKVQFYVDTKQGIYHVVI